MKVETIELPKKYHSAVEHWRRHNFKDYQMLLDDYPIPDEATRQAIEAARSNNPKKGS